MSIHVEQIYLGETEDYVGLEVFDTSAVIHTPNQTMEVTAEELRAIAAMFSRGVARLK